MTGEMPARTEDREILARAMYDAAAVEAEQDGSGLWIRWESLEDRHRQTWLERADSVLPLLTRPCTAAKGVRLTPEMAAAAPRMLEALQAAVDAFEAMGVPARGGIGWHAWYYGRGAIAEATGTEHRLAPPP